MRGSGRFVVRSLRVGQAHCPVHGCREAREERAGLSRQSTSHHPHKERAGLSRQSTPHHPHQEREGLTRGRPGQSSLRLGRSVSGSELERQSSVRIPSRKFSEGSSPRNTSFLPELPDYFKRSNWRPSISSTKTANIDLSFNKNIHSSLFSSAFKVINQNCSEHKFRL